MLKIYGELGINGTFAAVWLAHIGFGMSLAIYILRNYMATLPKTVIESAKIDGASHFQTFFKLVLPMSMPALAAFAIFQFLWVWNDLLVALVFIGPGDNEPLTVGATAPQGPARPGLEPRHGRRLPHDDRADRGVPVPAAVLRPRPHRGSRQGLTVPEHRGGPDLVEVRAAVTSDAPGAAPSCSSRPPASPGPASSWPSTRGGCRSSSWSGLSGRPGRWRPSEEPVPPVQNGPGMPLLGEHAHGLFTRPHLRGHRLADGATRTGADWSTRFVTDDVVDGDGDTG